VDGHFSVVLAGNGVGRRFGTFFKHASTFNKVFGFGHRGTSLRSSNLANHIGFSCYSLQLAACSNHRVATVALTMFAHLAYCAQKCRQPAGLFFCLAGRGELLTLLFKPMLLGGARKPGGPPPLEPSLKVKGGNYS
jgi:hypothetical protein